MVFARNPAKSSNIVEEMERVDVAKFSVAPILSFFSICVRQYELLSVSLRGADCHNGWNLAIISWLC